MIKTLPIAAILLVLCFSFVGCGKTEKAETAAEAVKPPIAKVIPKELIAHGDTRIDNYFWLNQRDDPEVLEYLHAENAYKEAVMAHTEDFQEKLFDEIVSRIKKSDMSVPYKDQGYYQYSRFEEEGEYPLYCRKKGNLDAEEEIVLNVNEMAKGHDYYSVAGYSASSNNNLIAYGVDTVSRRLYTLYFMDLTTREVFKDQIPNTSGRATWANDNKTVFYAQKDTTTLRPYKIMKHVLGTDVSEDKVIYTEEDETFNIGVGKTKSKKFLFIAAYHTLSSEYRFLSADTPDGEFQIIQQRERDLEYDVDHFQDKFYIRTNLDAKNFRLMETPIDKTTKENWKEVIPHRDDVLFQGFEIFKDFLVLGERKNGLREIRVIKWADRSEHYLDFGEEAYTAFISTNLDFDTDLLRYSYTSLTTPNSTFDYDMVTREKKLLKQQEVLGDFDPNNYVTERHFATARDNTKVPISLVYRKGLEKDGSNPLLLNGYGSYGSSREPTFSSVRLSLLDRGFVFAIPHIRGGALLV
jgi:oligopeptidase B